jgi:hypothetical protein
MKKHVVAQLMSDQRNSFNSVVQPKVVAFEEGSAQVQSASGPQCAD